MPLSSLARRSFVLSLATLGMAALPSPLRALRSLRPRGPHPTPRPGIDASRVLPASELLGVHVLLAFNAVRGIPQVVDGIRCHCGCADAEGFYSLLSCYEGHGMAQYCEICQGEGLLARRLHDAGKSLDEIRAAIDVRFG
ncbi:MAG TPA: hypothetical protein VFX50_18330 [Gemmatimonadales bacterium]|nr:hypothetical protein [Gemmatimonadales bacterium]